MPIFNILFWRKSQSADESPNFPTLNSEFTPVAKEQPPEREIPYICGLGAKVGCERLSEHSTCRDESHKYRGFLFLKASTLPAANQKSTFSSVLVLHPVFLFHGQNAV